LEVADAIAVEVEVDIGEATGDTPSRVSAFEGCLAAGRIDYHRDVISGPAGRVARSGS
jgi:hypothetical protein